MRPREPHLLAGRIERHRQSRQDPVGGPERLLLQEQATLGIHERRRTPVRDSNTLGDPSGAGGEDDPRVVIRRRLGEDVERSRVPRGGLAGEQVLVFVGFLVDGVIDGWNLGRHIRRFRGILTGRVRTRGVQAATGDDTANARLAEYEGGALLRVIRVDRHVCSAGSHHTEDGDVELFGARRHADADAIAMPHASGHEARGGESDPGSELPVAHRRPRAVIDRGSLGMATHRLLQDVDERTRRSGVSGPIENGRLVESHRSTVPGSMTRGEGNTADRPSPFTSCSPLPTDPLRVAVYRHLSALHRARHKYPDTVKDSQ